MTSDPISNELERRLLALEGGDNFRDLGGYRAADGACVKWGEVYRSGQLSRLTDSDQAKIKDLNIVTVVDLRREEERMKQPSRWHTEHKPQVHTSTHPYDASIRAPQLMGQFVKSFDNSRQGMLDVYWDMPIDHAEHYRKLFASLANHGARAVLFHCAAGKDRTGLAAALILTALGVLEDDIYEDYLLTNVVSPADERLERFARSMARQYGLDSIPPESLMPIVVVEPDYLEQAFKRIEQDFGSVEVYLREALKVDAAMMEELRAALLE